MGQQQLLLLVLGIVLVGLAVVVGIGAFNENKAKTNLDMLTSDAVRLSTAVQAWKMKPRAAGGGQSDTNFDRATFEQLGIQPQSGTGRNSTYETGSGRFRIKTFIVSGDVAYVAQQQYGITDTGNAVAIVGLSKDGTQSVMIAIFASNPDRAVTILQHPYNTEVYNTP
ncbi:MAG TPA: hypothetical protein VGB53_13940 [Rubricoccaceae bacterium]|jgi:S-formylglutathione hydrolase FrmB